MEKGTRNELISELQFCLKMREEKGFCQFGGQTNCNQCGTPYLLLKLINGEVLHGDIKRLELAEWKKKFQIIKKEAK